MFTRVNSVRRVVPLELGPGEAECNLCRIALTPLLIVRYLVPL